MEPKDESLQSVCINDAEIGALRRRELEGPRFLECMEHIVVCDSCRARLARTENLASAELRIQGELRPLVEHIPEEEVQQYVSGRLRPARVDEIEGHLARCSQCAEEIRDLRNFAASLHPVRTFFARREFMALAAAVLVVVAITFLSLLRPREIVVMNDASGTVTLDQHGTLNGVGFLGPDQQNAVRLALTEKRLSFPASLQSMHEEPGTLMGPVQSSPFQLEAPIRTIVRNNRPTLFWTSDSESTGYKVTVKDQNTGEIKRSPLLQVTSWTVSDSLDRGHTYLWQVVSAHKNGEEVVAPQPPSPPAKFIILDTTTDSKLQQLPSSHLARAILYANAGLLDDADKELRILQAENPQSTLVQSFVKQLRQAARAE